MRKLLLPLLAVVLITGLAAAPEAQAGPGVGPIPLPGFPSSVSGQVTDFNGQPLAGVLVQLYDRYGNLVRTGQTDANGNYLHRAPADTYKIYIKGDVCDLSELVHLRARQNLVFDAQICG